VSQKIMTDWLDWPETKTVIGALDAVRLGGARFVGGCVRNAVLGRPADDIDIATQLLPEQVIGAAKAAKLSAIPTGIEHGTITVIANHKPYEVTTLRRDVETDGRRATVAFTTNWEEDAARRDFRLNALYADLDGTVYDPTGGGVEDARAGRVIFVGDAETRIREDYLRILRFFRFSAWYAKGELDAPGLAACAALKDGLAQLSAERVWKEVKKLLAADDPRPALEAMAASGVFAAVLPESEGLARLSRLVAIDADYFIAPDPVQRFAALLPDDPEIARAAARRLKLSNDERERLVRALSIGTTRDDRIVPHLAMRETRRVLYRLGRETFEDRVKLAWARDESTKRTMQWRALLAHAESWKRPHFPLSGDQVIKAGAAPGPMVGQVMREVEDWWIDADFTDDQFSLMERLKAVVTGLA
jgi:poly(A) polymerase